MTTIKSFNRSLFLKLPIYPHRFYLPAFQLDMAVFLYSGLWNAGERRASILG